MLVKISHTLRQCVMMAGLALLTLLFCSQAQAVTCQVDPGEVAINLTYHGTKLTVSGENKAGDDLIIRISSPGADAHYKYIGKAGGIFWMKKGDVSYKNVPGVYLLYSSREMENLLDPQAQRANLIGYEAIKETAEMETEATELQDNEASWKEQFISFKQKQNLYAIHTGTVTRQHGQENDAYQVTVDWPYQAGPGTYTVEAMAIRNGQIAERAETQFTVDRAGLVKQLSDLAFNSSALYGIMAVVIAIFAGFAVGMIFKKGGGAH